MSDYLDPGNEELLKDFFVEAEMQVETLESNILVLENDPTNSDSIDEIFRAAHTLKGGAATVQMTELTEFTHLLEDCLDAIRNGLVRIDGSVIDILLNSIDVTKVMLQERRDGGIYTDDISDIKNALKETMSGSGNVPVAPEKPHPASPSSPPVPAGADPSLTEYELLELKEAAGDGKRLYAVVVEFNEENPMNSVGGIQLFAVMKQFADVLKTDPAFEALYYDVYHPRVTYYIATSEDPEAHRGSMEISDVTDRVTVRAITGVAGGSGAPAPGVAQHSPPAPRTARLEPAGEPQRKDSVPGEPEDDEEEALPKRTGEVRRGQPTGSVLRVESRRIDNLLNLVSETVINKAAFNQISNAFAEDLSRFQQVDSRYREMLKELFDSLPEYLDRIQKGQSVKEVRKQINEQFSDLPTLFDGFQGSFKTSVAKFRNTSQNLSRITSELQEGVMRIRMVPISQIFSRFPRLVRDLSRSLKKEINLQIEGEDTELDKSVIEDLLDPLIHCVRNSIDHGIESAEARAESGKEAAGTVTLRASNEGNMILIEIVDDGAGIDVNAVRAKAIDRGVIHPNKQLSDIEAYNLIFDPGFSTAQTITNVSGRGVGLDVVKRQIEKLNGTVTVWSSPGEGTRFTIKIPLTLAIIQGLLVRVGAEMYAIPITSVIDSHRIRPSDIKRIDNYEVFNVREDVISLIRLSRLFQIPVRENPEYHYVVIVGSNDRKMGLVVDSLIGEEDVVIKPLRDHFTNSPGIAGANITGDGRVSLIIDVSQLLELGLRREKEERDRREMRVGR